MTVTSRPYTTDPGFSADFCLVRDFLVRINQPRLITPVFPWARWQWAFSLPFQDEANLDRITIWEDDGQIVAVATYELQLGDAFLIVDPAYDHLLPDMIAVARERLAKTGRQVRIIVPDRDEALQEAVYAAGFRPTDDREWDSRLLVDRTELTTDLAAGYRLVSREDEPDDDLYGLTLWRGFDHEPEGPYAPTAHERAIHDRLRSDPAYQMEHQILVIAPDGRGAAFCGMWQLPGTNYAVVEPVATVPEHRRMGLARTAIHEAVRRVAAQGATEVWVGSTLPLYRAIGFRPYGADTWWEKPTPHETPA
jgi:predicted N-acetyltransferase YhbS